MTTQPRTINNVHPSQSETWSNSPVRACRTALIFESPLMCSGLRRILEDTSFVLAEPVAAIDLRRGQALAAAPSLVIIEANRDTARALRLVSHVREQYPEARIVALADQFDPDFVRQGHGMGVDGFCSTSGDPDALIKRLELVMLQESVFPADVLHLILDEVSERQDAPLQGARPKPSPPNLAGYRLSAREAEILDCLREGSPNKVIARKLDITEATIKVHVKAIMRKLGVANRTQAALWASQRLTQ